MQIVEIINHFIGRKSAGLALAVYAAYEQWLTPELAAVISIYIVGVAVKNYCDAKYGRVKEEEPRPIRRFETIPIPSQPKQGMHINERT